MDKFFRPEDFKIVQGQSGRGLQILCLCGCVNWNHLEISEASWTCRNCYRAISYNFPELVRKVLALQPKEAAPPAPQG